MNLKIKALFDFVCALAVIVLLSPVFLLAAAAVGLTSGLPLLIAHRRVGLHGKEFRVYKFRTMVKDAHLLGTSVTAAGDPRITAVGRLLRRTKLDELPQLLNILKGEMSLVGPRPDVPGIIAGYTPEMRRVLEAKPGITSLATLHFRNEEELLARVEDPDSFYDKVLAPLKVKLAMEHVERNSFWFDLKILLQTVWMITPLRMIYRIKDHPLVAELKRALP